jgi:glycosyltransferase involved in cell wall biosynthesis
MGKIAVGNGHYSPIVHFPKISVITVCLNAQEFIEQCIQSVLDQTFNDFEYVIIDGSSTDNTVDIIKKYQNKIAYWHSQPDRGLADAFNLGVQNSSGEWLLFLNSDDYFASSNILQDMVVYLNKYPDADVIFGQIQIITREQVAKKIGAPYGKEINWKKFCRKDTLPHQAAFSPRSFYERIGPFSEDFLIAVDYEHYLRAGPELNTKFIPLLVTNMRDGGMGKYDTLATYREWMHAQVTSGRRSIFFAFIDFIYLATKNKVGIVIYKLLRLYKERFFCVR